MVLSEALIPLHQLVSAVVCRRIISSVKAVRTEVHLFVLDNIGIDLTSLINVVKLNIN